MNAPRTKSLSTKVTPEEYERFQVLAEGQPVSEWVRAALLKAAAPSFETVLLAEVLALRSILLNLHFALASGEPLTAEAMHRLIARADHDKCGHAHECLASSMTRRDR